MRKSTGFCLFKQGYVLYLKNIHEYNGENVELIFDRRFNK